MDENIEYKDIIELIYKAEEETLDNKIKEVNKRVKDKIKDINIEKLLDGRTTKSEITKIFETIEENYSIRIAEYDKEFYKQGFIDGVNLMINCCKN